MKVVYFILYVFIEVIMVLLLLVAGHYPPNITSNITAIGILVIGIVLTIKYLSVLKDPYKPGVLEILLTPILLFAGSSIIFVTISMLIYVLVQSRITGRSPID
jgi:hypothetical protein